MRSRRAFRWAALLATVSACVEAPLGPGRFGEVRVEPSYRAGYEPAAVGVTLDSAGVLVRRHGSGETLLDRTVPYSGGALAYLLDLAEDVESVSVAVELWSGADRRYAGDTSVVVEAGTLASGVTHAMRVAWVGPPVVVAVTVSPGTAALDAVGETQAFTATARDPDGAVVPGAVFAWSSSNGAVASVDPASGLATVTGEGTTTISASAGLGSGSATLSVDLPPSIASVIVSPPARTLDQLGATQAFAAEARDSAGNLVSGVAFAWSSSNVAVATVDPATGLATAVGQGSVTITAAAGSVSGSATLTVTLETAVASVVVSPEAVTLAALGATQQFTAEARDAAGRVLPGVAVTWSSGDEGVAMIGAQSGVVTAVGHGSTSITATAGTISGSASVVVSFAAAVASVEVSPATAALSALGATQAFSAVARDAAGNVLPGVPVNWSSADEHVATVDAAGLATATGHGATLITATAGGVSESAELVVTLTATIATVSVTPEAVTLGAVGATQGFSAEVRDAAGNPVPGVPVTWSGSNGAVATVDAATGLATATGHGTAIITARAGSVEGSAMVTVELSQAVASVVVSPVAAALSALGATQAYAAEARDASGNVLTGVPFTWSSSNELVATIDAGGVATATGHGTATITATAGSVSGTASLTVALTGAVAEIIVSPATATLTARGATLAYSAEARDAAGHVLPGVPVTWTSSDPGVAEIDAEEGLASATDHGTVTITATSGDISGSAALTVDVPLVIAVVVVTPDSATITLPAQSGGESLNMSAEVSQQFTAEARDVHGHVVADALFAWHSTDTTVASVDETGFATALAAGVVQIKAVAGDGVTGRATLVVVQASAGVRAAGRRAP